MTTEIIWIHWL